MLHAPLIFITKYRGKIVDSNVLTRMEAIMNATCLNFEVERAEFNGEHDPCLFAY